MESYKVLISIALFAACVFAAQAAEVAPEQPLNGPAPGPLPLAPLGEKDAPLSRAKKQALFPLAYSAYPSAYPYYSYYPAAYPYSYSYQYYDDGKYYPGKYEKPYYRSYPYYYPYY